MADHTRGMLEKLYETFSQKYPESLKAWDNMLAFIASFHCGKIMAQFENELEWVAKEPDMLEQVRATYDPRLMKGSNSDALGDMYFESQLDNVQRRAKSYAKTPWDMVNVMSAAIVSATQTRLKIVDPCAGTGRLLLALATRAPNGVYFGIEDDLRISRIALTNLMIHDVHGYILNANYLMHATDLQTEAGRHNWRYSNKWYSQMHNLLPAHPLQN